MKWFQHEEHEAIQAAVNAWREDTDGTADDAVERLVGRVEMALRSTDWRRVEAHKEINR
jgi:hypothetical protein